jgi:hypothetical protein
MSASRDGCDSEGGCGPPHSRGRGNGAVSASPRKTTRPTEAAMSSLFQAARDNARDILAAAAASVYFAGFFGAIHAALDKLAY